MQKKTMRVSSIFSSFLQQDNKYEYQREYA